jgi:hypothetical protein
MTSTSELPKELADKFHAVMATPLSSTGAFSSDPRVT